jgi:sterol desaturase/sphingolipid hydroxylase (fatty acid hydroxylase superfamily)
MFFVEIFFGVLYANILEWVIHKYVLHGLGKKKGTLLSFHFHEHHKISRKNNGLDLDYMTWGLTKESIFLIFLLLLHTPIFFLSPVFFTTLFTYSVLYYCAHRKSHLDTKWARRWLPWHYDHHMGKNQEANWCVLFPLADYIFRSRIKYEYSESGRAIKILR